MQVTQSWACKSSLFWPWDGFTLSLSGAAGQVQTRVVARVQTEARVRARWRFQRWPVAVLETESVPGLDMG